MPGKKCEIRELIHALLSLQVIFSQTSELLERQSSMASSTEEVSGNMDLSTADSSRQHDTTDTEQRFGMYMREFDFLDCELESLEGESVDNFNWGVRRPSLSHLDGGSFDGGAGGSRGGGSRSGHGHGGGGSYQDLLGGSGSASSSLVLGHGGGSSSHFSESSTQPSAEITPVLPKRETRGGLPVAGGGGGGPSGGRDVPAGPEVTGHRAEHGKRHAGGERVHHYRHRRHHRTAARGVGVEESSDDEGASVRTNIFAMPVSIKILFVSFQ